MECFTTAVSNCEEVFSADRCLGTCSIFTLYSAGDVSGNVRLCKFVSVNVCDFPEAWRLESNKIDAQK